MFNINYFISKSYLSLWYC